MSTRSGRSRPSALDISPPKTRKGASPSRSPARNRKSSPPARSPSRKSPSRKSPSRKPVSKFPARKSPSRSTKESKEVSAPKSPVKRSAIKNNVEVKLVDLTEQQDLYRSTRPKRTEYSIKDIQNDVVERINGFDSAGRESYGVRNRKLAEDIAPRRSSRIIENDMKRSLSKSISKSVSQSIDTYSDEENSENEFIKEKSKSITRKLATPIRDSVAKLVQYSSRWEFGGRIGSGILIILLPLIVISIVHACAKNCSLNNITNLSALTLPSSWFGVQAVSLVAAQIVIQALLSYLPGFGAKPDSGEPTKKYSFNAFFSTIVTFSALYALDVFKIVDSNLILRNYLKLATASYIFGVILAIGLFLKSRKLDDGDLNPYGNTGYTLYDFWMGREIHPQLGRLYVKIWISRICNINSIILAALIFKHGYQVPATLPENVSLDNYRDVLSKIQLKPTILAYSLMQIVYISNFILREHKVTSTFYWQSEGVGYLQCVSSALYPFYFTTISKFVADTGFEMSTNTLVIAAVLFITGFTIMLLSNNIKHAFRKNPTNPALSNLETMPTFHGKKLLISNMWGMLRHPNYAGDILMHIVFALPGILTKQYVAAAPALFTILVLLHRAWRDHARCRRRYGAAWQRYCKRVPSLIIPKIL